MTHNFSSESSPNSNSTSSNSTNSDLNHANLPNSDLTHHSDLTNSDLEEVLVSFRSIQEELNYREAQDTLRDIVAKLDLTPQERQGLEPEIHSLEMVLDKLDRQVIHIAVFGMVGRGKSSLLNALLGQEIFETGAIHGITQTIQSAAWNATREPIAGSDQDLWKVSLSAGGNARIELIDTPGIDEVNGETRELLARELAKQADLILFVVAGDMTQVEFAALSELRQASKPILLVLNKIDQYPEADRIAIYEKIRDDRVRELLSPDEIVMAAASPLVAKAVRRADGKLTTHLDRGMPQVEAVKLKILEILHREGKSLVALNTMLYSSDINEKLVQRKFEIRDRSASQIIWNSTMTKSIVVALNPVMVIDLVSGAAIDVAMIVALSRLYGIPMTQQGAVDLLRKIALSLGGVTASDLLITFGLGSLKSMLGFSAPATGGFSLAPYLSVAITQASIAGVSTFGIGQVIKSYLANGASWGPDGPKAVIDRILSSLDETSILNRIKDELRAKLGDLSSSKATE